MRGNDDSLFDIRFDYSGKWGARKGEDERDFQVKRSGTGQGKPSAESRPERRARYTEKPMDHVKSAR